MTRARTDSGQACPARLLGLDIGEQRIGLALSDPLGVTAQPFGVLDRTSLKLDLDQLARLCIEHDVGGLVVGLPTDRHGNVGPQAQLVLEFADKLCTATGIPVATWDERFSTVAAERALREGAVPGRKRKGLRDRVAAQLILQGYMDAHREPQNDT